MIDALIAGRMYAAANERTSANGNPFVVAKVTATAGSGESLFVSVIAFSQSARTALLALDAGDSVALSGTLTPKVWIDRHGDAKPSLDMTAHAVLTAFHVTRKRKSVRADETRQIAQSGATTARPSSPAAGAGVDFDDLEDDF
jgi:single-stranded DNA-binding protein